MKIKVMQLFLMKTEQTGRFLVKSVRTGKVYAVEPIGEIRAEWGDLNPSTGKVEGSYGKKYQGSIDEEDSLITTENGFINITELKPGMSPMEHIIKLDNQYPGVEAK